MLVALLVLLPLAIALFGVYWDYWVLRREDSLLYERWHDLQMGQRAPSKEAALSNGVQPDHD